MKQIIVTVALILGALSPGYGQAEENGNCRYKFARTVQALSTTTTLLCLQGDPDDVQSLRIVDVSQTPQKVIAEYLVKAGLAADCGPGCVNEAYELTQYPGYQVQITFPATLNDPRQSVGRIRIGDNHYYLGYR